MSRHVKTQICKFKFLIVYIIHYNVKGGEMEKRIECGGMHLQEKKLYCSSIYKVFLTSDWEVLLPSRFSSTTPLPHE